MQKFLPYLIIVTVVCLLFDFVFLRHWTKFIKQNKWNPVYYQVMWGIAILMLLLSVWTMLIRTTGKTPNFFERWLYVITAIWYLPKLLIVPVIFVKDLFEAIYHRIRESIRKKAGKPIHEEETPTQESRRKVLQAAGWGLAAIPFYMSTYGLLKTTYNFQIKAVEVPMVNLPPVLDGLRIVQISDIHAGSFHSSQPMQKVEWMINSMKPDLIFLTGDYVVFHPDELALIFDQLKGLNANVGKFACLGNHDHYMKPSDHQRLIQIMKDTGADLLINENRTLDIRGAKLQIAGVDNNSYRQDFSDFPKAMQGLTNAYPTIMLCHDPTNWDLKIRNKVNADLTLSGHTHGGQVAIEVFGFGLYPAKWVYRQWSGLYNDRDQYLYVNDGIGTVGPPLRVGIDPEITLLTLRSFDNRA